MDSIEILNVGELIIKLQYDFAPSSPREMDNLGTITYASHSRQECGDEGMDTEEMEAIFNDPDYICLPVYMYDHSGISMNTTGFSCRFDSGQSSIIYVSREDIRKEWGVKRISKKLLKRVEDNLICEVDTFSKYLNGSVFGYIVESSEGDIEDSCWGFYGLENCREEAISSAVCLQSEKVA